MNRLLRNTIMAACLLAAVKTAVAQIPYPNFDFESGTLAGWTGFTGSCCPVYTPHAGFQSLQHAVTSGAGVDPYSLGQLPVVAPGGQHSLRLGNDSVHSEAEKVSYTLTVSPLYPILICRYAVVFEFPASHPPVKQPRFEARVLDASGAPLPCGGYSVVSSDNPEGFFSNGDYRIRPWTDAAIDLRDHIGKTVTVEFATGDCGQGGHFGYAYIDGYAVPAEVAVSPCHPDGSVTLTAPPGFQYAWSTGQTSQQVTLQHMNGGQTVQVDLLAPSGCLTTLSATIPSSVPQAAFGPKPGCGLDVAFENHSMNYSPGAVFHWDFGDGNQSPAFSPNHQYQSPGVYDVSLSVESGGCRGVHTASVTAEAAVKAGFSWLPSAACAGERFAFTDESAALRGTLKHRYWEFGDFSQSTDQNPAHVYIHPGEYAVSLVVTTGEGCTASAVRLVDVWPGDSCNSPDEVWIPNAFTPNGDGLNDYFTVLAPGMEIAGMDVFDRWGRRVYSAAGPARWDGRLRNGKPAPDGVYSFQITARWPGAAVRQITGHVLLLH